MRIETVAYHFSQGIPGFEHLQQFVFVEIGDDLPMKLMKAVDDQDVSLLVTSPFLFYPEYEWDLPESSKEELKLQVEGDIQIWTIVTVLEDPSKATINLMAPIVLNTKNNQGKQLILHDSTYSPRTPLIRE
ncbi:flagellar assembly protein FliW [Paenibacillus luteus]|uniref:flagellar assembly protein FliW n=1 Tax=Paenibacillus luteus TaxID=2545753 RepID=UPI0011419EC2|nr:flagellar assembly protein FliW [Paenibacillus luteus]